MPLYTWKHRETLEEIEVIRTMSNIETPPTSTELVDSGFEPEPECWVRGTTPSGTSVRRSNAFGFGKGYYNSRTPGRGRQ